MISGASPDNPIHRLKASEFGEMVEYLLLPMIGDRPHLSSQQMPDGSFERGHFSRLDHKWVNIERENPPHDPMGPSLSMTASTMPRDTRERRKKNGLKPSFRGGPGNSFNDLHDLFLGIGGSLGKILDKEKLGDNEEQQKRIAELLTYWSDNTHPVAAPAGTNYGKQLEEALASLKTVPVKLKVGKKTIQVSFDNAILGLNKAPLAHILLAAEKNSRQLMGRPGDETDFITHAISNFSRILVTTDEVLDYMRAELVKQGVENVDAILKQNNLSFNSEQAERILLKNAPMLKLATVIAPLVHARVDKERLKNFLQLVVTDEEEKKKVLPEIPPIHNAEHGARLIEAILIRVNLFDAPKDIDEHALKTYLRSSAHEAPFNVARLTEHEEVRKLLAHAETKSATDPELKRALDTLNSAISSQFDLGCEGDSVSNAVLYKRGWVGKLSDHVMGRTTPEKTSSSLIEAIDAGMNRDAFDAMIRDINHLFTQSEAPEKSYSEYIRDEVKNRAAAIRKDIPPLPPLR